MGAASKDFEKQTGITAKLTVDEANYLPDTCGGGIELVAMGGKVKCTNTLENRLDNACYQTLPVSRQLFGRLRLFGL